MHTLLIVEDDLELSHLFQLVLEQAQYRVYVASHGEAALELIEHTHFDLIITDIMMPRMDGFQFITTLRHLGYDTPMMIISVKDAFEDKRLGFRLGVDDYMVKPIDVNEMVLRVEALLRRSRIVNSHLVTVGSTQLDQESFTVTYLDHTATLPQKEFLLLHKLLSYPNRIFTRQQLLNEIWGPDTESEERTIDVHIKRLRDRFTDNHDFTIVTIRGLGYKAVLAA